MSESRAVAPNLTAIGSKVFDAAGSLVMPGFFNLHFHADKCLLGEVMRPNVSGTLPEAIEITNEFKRKYDPAEVSLRAVRALENGVKNGTAFFRLFRTSARSGAYVLRGGCYWRAKKWLSIADIQVVAFPQEGIVRDPGAAELMEETIKEGCDIVGGLPGPNTPTMKRASILTSASSWRKSTTSTFTCSLTIPTMPIPAVWNISR